MVSGRVTIGIVEVLGYLIGGVMLLPALMFRSDPAYLWVGLGAAGLLVILGSFTFIGNRRILPVGVTRDGNTIVCRYIPWYELNVYTMFVLIPLIGLSALAAASVPGKPMFLWFCGVVILGIVLLAGYFVAQLWRWSLLTFTPSSVTVRLPRRGSELTEIPRSRLLSITDANAEDGAAVAPQMVAQVALTYQPADQSSDTATVLIGPPAGKTALQVSVHPANVYTALLAWKNADPTDPRLMDRIESILRSRKPASS